MSCPDQFQDEAVNDVQGQAQDGIERTVLSNKPGGRRSDKVVLEKMPERIRDRRMGILLSVLVSVMSLVFLFLWNFDFVAVFQYDIGLDIPDVEMGMTVLDSALESGSAVVLAGIVATTFFALLGFVTPYLSVVTSFIFVLTAIESMYPFEMEVNHLPYMCMGTVEQASGMMVYFLILASISVASVFLVSRSLSASRSFFDRETRMGLKTLLLYNITGDWNVVFRRKVWTRDGD